MSECIRLELMPSLEPCLMPPAARRYWRAGAGRQRASVYGVAHAAYYATALFTASQVEMMPRDIDRRRPAHFIYPGLATLLGSPAHNPRLPKRACPHCTSSGLLSVQTLARCGPVCSFQAFLLQDWHSGIAAGWPWATGSQVSLAGQA